jgi:hypothetical protein
MSHSIRLILIIIQLQKVLLSFKFIGIQEKHDFKQINCKTQKYWIYYILKNKPIVQKRVVKYEKQKKYYHKNKGHYLNLKQREIRNCY